MFEANVKTVVELFDHVAGHFHSNLIKHRPHSPHVAEGLQDFLLTVII